MFVHFRKFVSLLVSQTNDKMHFEMNDVTRFKMVFGRQHSIIIFVCGHRHQYLIMTLTNSWRFSIEEKRMLFRMWNLFREAVLNWIHVLFLVFVCVHIDTTEFRKMWTKKANWCEMENKIKRWRKEWFNLNAKKKSIENSSISTKPILFFVLFLSGKRSVGKK